MDDKSKYSYCAAAQTDEAQKSQETFPPKKKTRIKKPFAAVLTVALIAAALAAAFGIAKSTAVTPEPVSEIEPFRGESGNYSGATFVSLANAAYSAGTVFGSDYYSVAQTYRQSLKKLSAFFDELTKKMLEGKSGAVVSPVNVYAALSALAECTDGTSRRQILDLIGVTDIEELREQSKLVWLYNSRDDGYGRSLLGNSVWLSSDMPVKENCVKILNDDHYASVFTGDFAADEYKTALKQWISDQTCGLLDDCVNAIEIPDGTAAALVSTLCYKTRWNAEYRETEQGTFKGAHGSKDCVFNKKTLMGEIYVGDCFTAFGELLSDRNSMWFFLPDPGKSTNDVIKSGLVSFINSEKDGKTYDVTVRMPDFDVDFNGSVTDVLHALGVTDCADHTKADFSPLTDDGLYLDEFIHSVRFKADKKGVEGAAFSVMRAQGGSPKDKEDYDFTLDKPFVFMVVNNGVPLFVGTVGDIKQTNSLS